MRSKSWVLLVFLGLLFLQVLDSQAQIIQKKYTIRWTDNLVYQIDEETKLEFLNFEGAVSDFRYRDLPVFFQKIAVDNFFSDCEVRLAHEVYEPLNADERKLVPVQLLKSALDPQVNCYAEKGKPFAMVTLLPFVADASGQVRKLVSFEITLVPKSGSKGKAKGHEYAANSVLSSGLWYKVSVKESGLYKLTFENLTEMGFSGSSVLSASISVFGNGTGRLSEVCGTPRPDDLLELPLLVHDGGDGVLGAGDYVVFYAKSPHAVSFNPNTRVFSHDYNIYSDYNYYYVCLSGVGERKRIGVAPSEELSASQTVSDYIDYRYEEVDAVNLAETGQEWFSDLFDVTTQRSYSISFPNIKSETARLTLSAASNAASSSSFAVEVNGSAVGSLSIPAVQGAVARREKTTFSFVPTRSTLSVTLTFNRFSSVCKGYLDYIAVQAVCPLTMSGGQLDFNNGKYVSLGAVNQYQLSNAGTSVRVWDVTDPSQAVQIPGTLNGSTYQFVSRDTAFRQFVAFDGSSYKTVTPVGLVQNQNLHGEGSQVDMIIVAHPDFWSQAERLAQTRRQEQGLTVKLVTPTQVYNEFSSGAQDPVAIRDYMKMIYEKSNGVYPKYLLLFGRPCYDYRGRVSGTTVFVPNYQRPLENYISEGSFRANDDFFGILDDGEGSLSHGLVDVAVGRFPVSTAAQANLAVTLSTNYTASRNLVSSASSKVSNMADWRNVICFVADDGDQNEHLRAAEECAAIVGAANGNVNLDKIYCDAYPQKSNAGGQRYPAVTAAINDRMDRGSLFFTYIGHSGTNGWAHERILEYSDINSWQNKYNQPVMMTLSCDFGWYDRPSVSPAEACFFNTEGGAAALITTSRVAYGGSNAAFARKFFANLFSKTDGHYWSLGEIYRVAKNEYGGNTDALSMFFLLGDPSMNLAIPQHRVVTDSVNGVAVSALTDTLKALSQVVVKGRVVDADGNTLQDFNGNLFTSLFDKKVMTRTLSNDPEESPVAEFEVQKNVIFKGNNTVKNGCFELRFVIPKDINYTYGKGKFSYYARSDKADAAGCFENFVVGGNSGAAYNDREGPQMEVYLNDEGFVNQGLTNPDPLLIVKLKDELGINTTGNGVGHDLVAILDGNNDSQIVLNDHYEAVQDSSNQGQVRYQLRNLSTGKHVVRIRAWDILNNVSEKELEFEVANDASLTLDHVLNYPNPFTTHTSFYFEHNHPGENLDVLVQIFTISGKLVKTISTSMFSEGTRSAPIDWDGRDDFGDKIGKGTYVYRLKVRTSDGKMAEKTEKVVLL
ncbi:MAG: type IX secretion system sortase PorU [Bacteroidales bacterium]|nr:type IX secretion system sortase PorU [Bacteroidales bacterium]